METAFYLYTIFVMLACAASGSVSLSAYFVSRRRSFLFAAAMLLFYFLDLALIFQYEYLGQNVEYSINQFYTINHPQLKRVKKVKKKPPFQHGDGSSIIGFTHQCRWWLCRDSRTKRNSAVQCSTQKCRSKPYRLTPTRWLRFCRPVTPVAPSFRFRLEPSAAR